MQWEKHAYYTHTTNKNKCNGFEPNRCKNIAGSVSSKTTNLKKRKKENNDNKLQKKFTSHQRMINK